MHSTSQPAKIGRQNLTAETLITRIRNEIAGIASLHITAVIVMSSSANPCIPAISRPKSPNSAIPPMELELPK